MIVVGLGNRFDKYIYMDTSLELAQASRYRGSGVSTDRIWEMGGGLGFTQATNVYLSPGVSTVSSIQNIPYNWSLHSYKKRVTCWS